MAIWRLKGIFFAPDIAAYRYTCIFLLTRNVPTCITESMEAAMVDVTLEKIEDTARRYGVKDQTIRVWLTDRNGKPRKIPSSAVVRIGNSAKPRIRLIKEEVDRALLHFFV